MAEKPSSDIPPPLPAIVLLVDDEPSIRAFASMALRGHVQEVHVAASGTEGQRLAVDLPHLDILITDIILPDFPGLQLAEIVRRWHPRVRVLVMSGYLPDHVAGPDMVFLQKPFSAAELIARVREAFPGEPPGTRDG